MSAPVCPHCGYDLEQASPISRGSLEIDRQALDIRWRGHAVQLTPTQRCIVRSLAAANGATLRRQAIAGVAGFEDGRNAIKQVHVHVHDIRRRFEQVDPAFAAIQSVKGVGYRWAA